MSELHEALKYFFGYDEFRNAQEEVVQRLFDGERLCVVMPTGAGKSLCYQLPVLMRPGYGLVISPLIALMKDQVDALVQRGIAAYCINSSIQGGEVMRAMEAVRSGMCKFLYVAPERFRVAQFRELLQQFPPSMVIVDEAHCISQWGHDFRPDYHSIWQNVPGLKEMQVAAFTATATPMVREDIRNVIGCPNMEDIVSGFQRPNLSFQVLDCTGANKMDELKNLLKKKEPTIVYAATRKDADSISQALKIQEYHAGMSESERTRVQNYFMTAECPMLVATNAFGMGIDRADVRRVIHYSLPATLEAYYQEAGRAGRDGKAAQCLVFFSYRDVKIQEFLIQLNNPPKDMYELLLGKLRAQDRRGPGMPIDTELLIHSIDSSKEKLLSSALRIMEMLGVVRRGRGGYGEYGHLRFIPRLDDPCLHQKEPLTQRSLFCDMVSTYFMEHHLAECDASLEALAGISHLRCDQVCRVLGALNGTLLAWDWKDGGMDSGGGYVSLTPLGRNTGFQIDYASLAAKERLDLQRLEDVKTYCRMSRGCRQAFIIKYFGEKIRNWTCGVCDFCRDKPQDWRAAPSRRGKRW